MALMNWATTRVTMVVTISLQTCKSAYKFLKDVPSSGLKTAIRLHEGGIASNRG